jgi:hypothetical protein
MLIEMARLSRDQKRKKKLAERAKRRPQHQLQPHYGKAQIAEAVHHAVCQHTGTDGFGYCRWYAACGWLLLQSLGYEKAVLQSGRLSLHPDPNDPTLWIEMDPSHGVIGELHCWVVLPDENLPPGRHRMGQNVQVIDFAARHYRSYVERTPMLGGSQARWRRENPPDFIWDSLNRLPPWLLLSAQEQATNSILRSLNVREGKSLLMLAQSRLAGK